MESALRILPCFNQIERITLIASGLSQHCFKINADNHTYFAKTIDNNTEITVATCASNSGLSPNILYYDQQWLITHFIEAKNLALSTKHIDDKLNDSIKLMAQCHQLTVRPAELSPRDIINALLIDSPCSSIQTTELLAFADLIIMPINDNKNGVCCHGDLNFSNVLINEDQRTWLIDYECACTAPIEYDLAMFIAVNELTDDKTTAIIEQYQVQSCVSVDPLLLNSYLQFCYLINALWYFNSCHEETHIERKHALLKYAEKQWSALQSSLELGNSTLFNSLSSKLTNILPTLNFKNQT